MNLKSARLGFRTNCVMAMNNCLLYNGHRVFSGGKVRPGRVANHSPISSAEFIEEKKYTSSHPLGHNRACNGAALL